MEDKELNQNSGLMLKNMQIPKDSDFRLSSIKFDFSQILVCFIRKKRDNLFFNIFIYLN